MSKTKKNIIDDILNILYKFRMSDEHSVDEDWLSSKIDDARAEIIRKVYSQTGTIDQTWLSDISLIQFYKTNYADDANVPCDCSIGKTTIPQFVTIDSDSTQDLGIFALSSSCGKYQYTPMSMYRWQNIPNDHPLARFKYYFRINTQLYVSDTPTQLRMIGVLHCPEDGYLINSAPVASGSIVNGTVYIVKQNTVVYNGTTYAPNATFTGAAATTFTTTNGLVYLASQAASYRVTDPYPLSADLIRQIEVDILTKEFRIEEQQIADTRNDSTDDRNKPNA